MISVASYNCNSICNSVDTVKELLRDNHFVALQELMLLESDLSYLSSIDYNMHHTAYVKDDIRNGINTGRPSKGVAIFWKSNLSSITPIQINEWLIGVVFNSNIGKTLLLNVYLPYDNHDVDSLDNYRNALGVIEAVIDENNISNLCIIGDFNADPHKGRFWMELSFLINNYNLKSEVSLLSSDNFTFLSPAHNSTSWLDHMFCNENLYKCIDNVSIDYTLSIFDHFPIKISFNLDVSVEIKDTNFINSNTFVEWNKLKASDFELYKNNVDKYINDVDINRSVLGCNGCVNEHHKKELDNIFDVIVDALLDSSSDFCFFKKRYKVIPGWNDNVKDLYKIASNKFLIWKHAGKPRDGLLSSDMRLSRSNFRNALRFCKINEDKIINDKIASEFENHNSKGFWREIKRKKGGDNTKSSNSICIDDKDDPNFVAGKFSDYYRSI